MQLLLRSIVIVNSCSPLITVLNPSQTDAELENTRVVKLRRKKHIQFAMVHDGQFLPGYGEHEFTFPIERSIRGGKAYKVGI